MQSSVPLVPALHPPAGRSSSSRRASLLAGLASLGLAQVALAAPVTTVGAPDPAPAVVAPAPAPVVADPLLHSLGSEVATYVPRPLPQTVPPNPQEAPQPAPQDGERLRSWEMPAIEVVGEPVPEYKDDELVGPYKQPRWTTHRLFTTVRSYVLPEGEIDAEYWARIDDPEHGETKVRNLYEVEFGLPHRFQLDLYLKAQNEGNWVPFDLTGNMIELRYALADWDEIWGNPTLYLEWINNYSEADAWEGKLLFAGTAAPGWHWASNLSCEQQTTDEQERELQFTAGLSKTIVDEKFSAGAEFKAQTINTKEDRSDRTDEFFLGPSFQYKPIQRMHIDFAPLVGIGGDSPNAQIFLIIGYEF